MVQIASVTALDGAQLAVDEHIAVRIHADRVAVLEGHGQAVGSQLVLAGLDKVRIGGVGLLAEQLYDSGFLVVIGLRYLHVILGEGDGGLRSGFRDVGKVLAVNVGIDQTSGGEQQQKQQRAADGQHERNGFPHGKLTPLGFI